ncbi:hypothetical protein [Pectinatus frisingensis]|uniref:hypothetical protein n=1 Tax=Pectinatus frisingensis TaxID=865 RepID=UPI0018C5676A|nr:hypothetical protein [Pectinatus frisingensis]
MSLNEYKIDDTAVAEWIPWGGLFLPHVMRQKDGSYFSVIKYKAYVIDPIKKITQVDYKRGWCIWIEKQHKDDNSYFITICWNPFYSNTGKISNTLMPEKVTQTNELTYFNDAIKKIKENISSILPDCYLLERQELLDFLSFTLSFGINKVAAPYIYLYLDIYLSENIKINFGDNNILINDKTVMILSLPGCPNQTVIDKISRLFKNTPYRYVKRLLMLDQKEAEIDYKKYTKGWCDNRSVIKSMVMADLISDINGYYSENFLILLNKDIYYQIQKNCREFLADLKIPYILESYNLKDIWWGSIPGIFRANIVPPLTGFKFLDELLIS